MADDITNGPSGSAADPAAGKRSPSYPALALEDALLKVNTIYKEDRANPATPEVIAQHLGTTPKSSAFLQTLAALQRFGLLEEIEGKPRRLKLTKDAVDLYLLPSDDPRRSQLTRAAALRPKVFAELWELHGTDLPSDANLRYSLITERGFLDNAADDLIKKYKKTIAFAGLGKGDTVLKSGMESRGNAVPQDLGNTMNLNTNSADTGGAHNPTPGHGKPNSASGQKDFPLYLSNNQRAVLFVPATMTAKDYELLKKQIENHLLVIEATSVTEPSESN